VLKNGALVTSAKEDM